MISQVVLFFLLVTFATCLLRERKYKPLRCEETNINQTRSSLIAACLKADECYIIRPVGNCPKKQVCCVKKRSFKIEENEWFDPLVLNLYYLK
ncbi:uncharacterized protein LOC108038152 [Drosophila rhopaloa]|uniref:Uncharacterized protein LOC108038152 n=1 Tax=Drosophila rhopaloa TaxID=1041015 RepID=A0A6P4DXX5_DRORH|nr:uncharacterized protein LOC108038152 [Drosophila rhopaloa]